MPSQHLPRPVKLFHVEPFRIVALWSTGEKRVTDFSTQSLVRWRQHPDLQQLTNPSIFCQVELQHGQLTWPRVLIDYSDVAFGDMPLKQPLALDSDQVYAESQPLDQFDPKPRIARLLKQQRLKAGLSQAQLAQRVGLPKSYISKLERGLSDVQFGTLEWILEAGFDKHLGVVE